MVVDGAGGIMGCKEMRCWFNGEEATWVAGGYHGCWEKMASIHFHSSNEVGHFFYQKVKWATSRVCNVY